MTADDVPPKKEESIRQKLVSVTNIRLDPHNPRVAWMAVGSHTTQDLFQEYWALEDILPLVRSIGLFGFYPYEQIIVMHESGRKYTVLEGNRRLVAVRSILDPTLAPQKHRGLLETIRQERGDELEQLRVWVYPSRDDVLPRIIQKHATADSSSWESLMKARVYWDFAESHRATMSVEQMASALGVSKAVFSGHYREYLLYSHIKAIGRFTQSERELIDNERRFQISTLVRIVKVASVRADLGLNESWELDPAMKPTFEAMAYLIVLDIIREHQDSRTLENNDKIVSYFESIKSQASVMTPPSIHAEPSARVALPVSLQTGGPHSAPTTPADQTGAHQQQTPRMRARQERKSFFQSKVSYRIPGNDALKRLFDTLNDNKKVIPEDDSIACGILIRSFLDKGTRVLFERKGILKIEQRTYDWSTGSKVEKITSVDVSNSGVKFVELLQLARGVHAAALGVDAGIAESLKTFENPVGGSVAMLEKLNNLVHKPAGEITSAELRDLWPRLEKYVRLLVEVI